MGGGVSSPKDEEAAKSRKEQGDEFYRNKDYNSAIMKYTEAIRLDKTKAIYFSNRSACYLEVKQYSKASDDGRKCMDLDGRFVKGYYRYARAQKFLGNITEATKYAKHGLSIDPSSMDLRHLLVEELGVLESELPNNPNKDIQQLQQPPSTIPVVAAVAVPSAGETQQQPMMMQGQQQPMMMQGQQQPMMMQGQQQPMMMQGQQQPMMMQGQQTMIMQGQQPMMMQPQPMMMQGQQPMMVQQQPMMMSPGPGQRGSRPNQDGSDSMLAAGLAGLVGGAMLENMFG